MLDKFNPMIVSQDLMNAVQISNEDRTQDLYETFKTFNPDYSEIPEETIYLAGGMFLLGVMQGERNKEGETS